MKNKSFFLSLFGLLVAICKPFLTTALPIVNVVDSQYPLTNIAGTVPPLWPYFVGAVLIVIGLIFEIAEKTDHTRSKI